MNVEQIINFITIAKTKNITHTSEILYLAQSTVSHRLISLENELGCQLIRRQKGVKKAELTESGKAFLPLAERWVTIWQETEMFKNGVCEKRLNIGCVDSLVICLLSDFFARFVELYPHLHIQLHVMNSDDIYEKLKSREIDIGLTLYNYHYENVNIRPFLSERMYCVHSIEAYNNYQRISPSELDPKDEISFKCGIEYDLWHDFWFKSKSACKVRVNSIILVERYLCKGAFWSIQPETAANYLTKNAGCKKLEIENPPPNRNAYIVTRSIEEPLFKDSIALINKEIDTHISHSPIGSYVCR